MATTALQPEEFEFTPHTAEVAFPSGLIVTIRLVSEMEERRLQVKNQGDVEKLLEERGKLRIVGWKGLTPSAFVDIAPECKVPDPDPTTGEIEFNAHLKGSLYRFADGIAFRVPIEEAHDELRRQYREKKKQGLTS